MANIIDKDWLIELLSDAITSFFCEEEEHDPIRIAKDFVVKFDSWEDGELTVKLVEETGDDRFPEDTIYEYETESPISVKELENVVDEIFEAAGIPSYDDKTYYRTLQIITLNAFSTIRKKILVDCEDDTIYDLLQEWARECCMTECDNIKKFVDKKVNTLKLERLG